MGRQMTFPSPINNSHRLRSLRLRWLLFALFYLAFASGGYLLLRETWQPGYALRWLVLASFAMAYLLFIAWHNLRLNYTPVDHRDASINRLEAEPVLLPDLGAGNVLTLLRGVWIAFLAGFLFAPLPPGWLAWVPGVLYLLACLGDFLDGALARLTRHVTRLGEVLDMEYDSLGVLLTVLLVIQYGQAPAWFLLVGLARYVFVGGLWIRQRLKLPNYDLPFSVRRRTLAGLQMGVLGVLLLPLFGPPGTLWVFTAFGLPLLVGFLWDWLVVIGRFEETAQRASRQRQWAAWSGFVLRWLALALILLQRVLQPATWDDLPLWAVLEWVIAGCFLLGIAGRITAILGLVSLGLLQVQTDLSLLQLLLILIYSGVLMLGTGRFSLWAPEERLVFSRLGENNPSKDQHTEARDELDPIKPAAR